jgi:transcriptional regulator with XRE-family HTH domain
MAKKTKPPAERTKKPGPDPTINQVFRDVEEYGTKRFMEWKKSLWECQEQVAAQLACSVFRLPSWMKYAREQAGFSQATLAALSGLSASAIANYESGYAPPTIDSAYEIYKALFERKSEHAAVALREIVSIYKTALKLVREHNVRTISDNTEYIPTIDAGLQKYDEEDKGYKAFIDAMRRAKGEGKSE